MKPFYQKFLEASIRESLMNDNEDSPLFLQYKKNEKKSRKILFNLYNQNLTNIKAFNLKNITEEIKRSGIELDYNESESKRFAKKFLKSLLKNKFKGFYFISNITKLYDFQTIKFNDPTMSLEKLKSLIYDFRTKSKNK